MNSNQENNALLDDVIAAGQPFALNWLRGAYHTHESQKARLFKTIAELRALALANIDRPLTVPEAQLLRVCRVCRRPYAECGNFQLDYGAEFACGDCLKSKFLTEGI